MTATMAAEDIRLTLTELLDRLVQGEEILLTRNQQPVARLVSAASIPQPK